MLLVLLLGIALAGHPDDVLPDDWSRADADNVRRAEGLRKKTERLYRQERYPEAQATSDEMWALASATLPPHHWWLRWILDTRAKTLRQEGAYRDAAARFEQLVAMLEKRGIGARVAAAMYETHAAAMWSAAGDDATACAHYDAARALFYDGTGRRRPLADVLIVEGEAYCLGRGTDVRGAYQHQLDGLERTPRLRAAIRSRMQNATGMLAYNLGLYDLALAHYGAAERRGMWAVDRASVQSNRALVLSEQGHQAEARVLLEEALDITVAVLGPDHPSLVFNYNNLALVRSREGDRERALALIERAVPLVADQPGSRRHAFVTNNHALYLVNARRAEEAREVLRPALEALTAGADPATALREAQLAQLRHNRVTWGHGRPAAWGAFLLSGGAGWR